jgi:spore coat polysaccharide biosynthesis protein SpsF
MGASRVRVGVFLQVRLKSTRLPRKALLPLAGKTVTEHAMEALSRVEADVHALLTDYGSADTFQPLAERCGYELFAGPEEDVLSRYALAVRHFRVDRYYRATGDNPLVSAELATSIYAFHRKKNADFSAYLGPPLGTGVEVTEARAILAAAEESNDPYEREHVSPFIYHRPTRFRVFRPWAQNEVCLPSVKITLDTPDDYTELTEIYESLYHGEPIPVHELVTWLRSREGSHEEKSSDNPIHSIHRGG